MGEADRDELERRHRALIERDRIIGLEAEAECARAHAARLQSELDIARARLARKNARIQLLVQRVALLEGEVGAPPAAGGLRPLSKLPGRRGSPA